MILFATILASGMAFLDGSVVNIALPTIQEQLNTTLSGIQWIVNSYTLMLASLILVCGTLGDRFGRKKIFIFGIAVFTFSSFLCALSRNINLLIFFRGLQGVGAALMVPGSLSIINTSFEDSVKGRVIGLWSGLSGGIAALGPFLGGFLVQTLGWPSIFYINIPLGILAFFITLQFVPESKNIFSKKVDLLGAVLILLSLLGIAFGLINEPTLGFTNPKVLLSLGGGLLGFTLFILAERKAKEPLVPFDIFKSPLVKGANLATLFLYFALSGVIFFLVLNFQQLQHYSPLFSGVGLLPTILLITFLSGPAGTLADRIGPRVPMIVGPFIVFLGMASFVFPSTDANYFTSFMPGLILFGLGMAVVIAPLTKSALLVKEELSGSASGVNNAVSRIAGLLAVALLGAVLAMVFSTKLQDSLNKVDLSQKERQEILIQKDKILAIALPKDLGEEKRIQAKKAIDLSFLEGFRIVMGINAFLALLASIISFALIRTNKIQR